MGLKRTVRYGLSAISYAGGWTARKRKADRGCCVVLAYHRVLPTKSKEIPISQAGMYVTRAAFGMQMRYLKKHYNVLTVDAFVEGLQSGFKNDQPACLVTFDDGWKDNYLNALPIMREEGVPGVVFLATDYVGSRELFWTDRASRLFFGAHEMFSKTESDPLEELDFGPLQEFLRKDRAKRTSKYLFVDELLEQMKRLTEAQREEILVLCENAIGVDLKDERTIMNWDEVLEMQREGVAIGSHTCAHHILTEIDENLAREEIRRSAEVIQEKTGTFPKAFCYPNGNANDAIVGMVAEAGYEAAFSVETGKVRQGDDRYRLKRFGMHYDITYSFPLFSAWIAGVF